MDTKSVGEKKSRSSQYSTKSTMRARSRQATDTKESYRKGLRYKDGRQCRSNLASSHMQQKEKRSTFKRRETPTDTSDEERSSTSMIALKNREVKSRELAVSSSDSEDFSSDSTSSSSSSKSYTHKKKSTHKDRHTSEKRK